SRQNLHYERWMTLHEALKHISETQKCSPIETQCMLKDQIGSGAIIAKWMDDRGGTPQKPKHLQYSPIILSEAGLAFDRVTERYRPLSVSRQKVLEIWPSTGTKRRQLYDALGIARHKKVEWITLARAVEHIRIVGNCDSLTALQELKEE